MKFRNLVPEDALQCIDALKEYGYSSPFDFFEDYRNLKQWIVDSLEIYLRYPQSTSSDIIFRKTLNLVDEMLWGKYGENLILEYTNPILTSEQIQIRIDEIKKRVLHVIPVLWESHIDGSSHDITQRLEKFARLKDYDKTLYTSQGAVPILITFCYNPLLDNDAMNE